MPCAWLAFSFLGVTTSLLPINVCCWYAWVAVSSLDSHPLALRDTHFDLCGLCCQVFSLSHVYA